MANAPRDMPLMPPLLEAEKVQRTDEDPDSLTTYMGNSCEHIVMGWLLSNKINWSKPAVDDGLDIFVDGDPKYRKGQIKKIIFKAKEDKGMCENSRKKGKTMRDIFDFRFQPCREYVKNARTKENTDVYYHVLNTCYRTLIFKIPTENLSTVKDRDGREIFVKMRNIVIDRPVYSGRKGKGVNIRDCLVFAQYDPIVFQTYPEFFQVKPTIDDFVS